MSSPQEAAAKLRNMSVQRAMVQWADWSAPLVRTGFSLLTPVGKGPGAGRLSNSISSRRSTGIGEVELRFQTPVPYAPYVKGPTRGHWIVATAARALRWTDILGFPSFAKRVWHPPMAGNPYPQKVADATLPDVKRLFRDALADEAHLVNN